ncbi:unnamed protein product [Somion occarium]|uniref:Uncharacterized protein n=1 Tax=Somion occarium TaxID=3059160 RepID=A0ABP1CPR1_9APHY
MLSAPSHKVGINDQRYRNIQALELDGAAEEYLSALTSIADVLGLEELSYASCYAAVSRLSQEELSLRRSILRLEGAEEELNDHLAHTKYEEALIRKWKDELNDADSSQSTAALERKKATLAAKAREYQKTLETVTTELPETSISLSELSEMREGIKKKEQILKEKRAKVQAYQGLPPNLDLARLELQKARQERMQLTQLRERLLSSMGYASRVFHYSTEGGDTNSTCTCDERRHLVLLQTHKKTEPMWRDG